MTAGSTIGMLLRLVFSLAVVLVLMALLARFLQQRQLGAGGFSRQRRVPLQVLGRQGVGRAASVTVVDVAGSVLVLGVTEQSIQVLRELSEEELAVFDEYDAERAAPAALPGLPGLPDLARLLDVVRERTTRRG